MKSQGHQASRSNHAIRKTILVFGSLSVVILLLFQLEKWSLFSLGGSRDLYVIVSGVAFLVLGAVISRYYHRSKVKRRSEQARSNLSEQEVRVLRLIAEGRSNKEIADELFIAETTVKSHVSSVLSKLQAKRRTEAVRIATEMHIL